MRPRAGRWLLLLPVLAYTAFSAGPYLWTATMSLRTTDEIFRNHYGLPIPPRWENYHRAWTEFGYATYFRNSAIVTVVSVAAGDRAGRDGGLRVRPAAVRLSAGASRSSS